MDIRRPIILLHGIFGVANLRLGPIQRVYFERIHDALRERGHAVLSPQTLLSSPVRQRAKRLREIILPWLDRHAADKAIIIAHSMGGLDARHMIGRLRMDDRVAALLTIATPHRGSAFADFCMENRPMRTICLPLLDLIGFDCHGGEDLTRSAAKRFNDEVGDSPRVRYFSISTACPDDRVPLLLRPSFRIIRELEGDNDGMVSAHSAKWGEHLETWPVHHLHAINRRFSVDQRAPVKDVSPLYLAAIEKIEGAIFPEWPSPARGG